MTADDITVGEDSPRLLTLQQVCEALSISLSTGRRLVREKRLIPVRLSRRLIFDLRDVSALVNSMKARG
jgi:excisionase family DNA binding protein